MSTARPSARHSPARAGKPEGPIEKSRGRPFAWSGYGIRLPCCWKSAFALSLTRILKTVMLVSLPATSVPETSEFRVVVTLQSLPGGVDALPFGTQSTGTGPKSKSVVVADFVYGP